MKRVAARSVRVADDYARQSKNGFAARKQKRRGWLAAPLMVSLSTLRQEP